MNYLLDYKNGQKKKVDQQMSQKLEHNVLKKQNRICNKFLIDNQIQNLNKLQYYKEYINQKQKIKKYQRENR